MEGQPLTPLGIDSNSIVIDCPVCHRTMWRNSRCPKCHPDPKPSTPATEVTDNDRPSDYKGRGRRFKKT